MARKKSGLVWDENVSPVATSLQGYLFEGLPTEPAWTFEETVARLITLTGQPATEQTDQYKVSVEFIGTFEGKVFTLYDYKEGRELHIGAAEKDVRWMSRLKEAIFAALKEVEPTPYQADEYYDRNEGHGWPARQVDPDNSFVEQVRSLLVDENGKWKQDVSGADVVQELTLILQQAGVGGKE